MTMTATPTGKKSGKNGKKQEADLKRVINVLKAASFRGYVVLEYEAAEDPKTAVPRYVKELRGLIG